MTPLPRVQCRSEQPTRIKRHELPADGHELNNYLPNRGKKKKAPSRAVTLKDAIAFWLFDLGAYTLPTFR